MIDCPKSSIVLLNYNSADDTIGCLQSLFRISYPNYNIVLIDNNSSDDSIEKIRQYLRSKHIYFSYLDTNPAENLTETNRLPLITIIQSGRNGGYGFGNNIGIKYALAHCADYVLVLNNDTIVDSGFLEPLVEMCEADKKIGIASSKIYFHDSPDVLWFNGGRFLPVTAKVEHVNFKERDIGQKTPKENTFISGCLWLIPRQVFEKVGFINEDYFMYVEDLEYCHRVLAEGYTLKVCEKSRILHKVGASTGGNFSEFSVFWMARNKVMFSTKFVPKIYWPITFFYLFFLNSMRWIKQKNIVLLKAHFKGLLEGLIHVNFRL